MQTASVIKQRNPTTIFFPPSKINSQSGRQPMMVMYNTTSKLGTTENYLMMLSGSGCSTIRSISLDVIKSKLWNLHSAKNKIKAESSEKLISKG